MYLDALDAVTSWGALTLWNYNTMCLVWYGVVWTGLAWLTGLVSTLFNREYGRRQGADGSASISFD